MKRYRVYFLMVLVLTIITSSAYPINTRQLDNGVKYIANRVIVMTDPAYSHDVVAGNLLAMVQADDDIVSVEPFYDGILRKQSIKQLADRLFIITTREDSDLFAVISRLENRACIQSAEFQPIPDLLYTPDDPYLYQQWHLEKVGAYIAWDYVRGEQTENVVIAVNDAGINYYHPDIAANIWYNENEDINGIDDDANGYIDDYMGWDFGEEDNDPIDHLGHGTGVAAAIAEVTDNATMGAGLGYSTRLMNLKTITDNGYLVEGYTSMFYAVEQNVSIINMSWGMPVYREFEQAIVDALWDEGVLMIAAGGERDDLTYPAAYNHVMAVSATDQDDHIGYFAPYGEYIDICAPGVAIGLAYFEGFSVITGTSFSAGMVSGLAGLIKAYYPDFTNEQIWQMIIDSADPIDDINPGYEGLIGAGRLNAANCFTTGIEENTRLPESIALIESYPNPFNAQTRMRFQLMNTADVELIIYDILGRKVEILELGERQAGMHSVIWDAKDKSSGVYFARLYSGGESDIVKMVLLK